jgi:type II secretory pathway component PulM
MSKPRRTYPARERSTSEKLSIVHQAHVDLRNREQDVAAILEAKADGATTWGIGDPIDRALETHQMSLEAHRALLARLEAEHGTLEQLRAAHNV